jgi:outer membrane protein OmpA-like peptidoglycan-associated protein
MLLPFFASALYAAPAGHPAEIYNLTQGKPVPIAAKKARFPLIVFGEEHGTAATFVPSGFMGDAESLKIKSAGFSAPLSSSATGNACLKIEITPRGAQRWVGMYWQTPANNWGKIKGAGYDLSRATKLTFWARGENGGEKIAEFKMGGLVGPYPDTDSASIGPIRLKKEWTQYTIDLAGKDLRHILGGFAFSVRRAQNPRGAVFYLDEIMYEGENSPDDVASDIVSRDTSATTAPTQTRVLKKPIHMTVPFPDTKTAFGPDGKGLLDEFVGLAQKFSTADIFVEGHTDDIGPAATNKKLSLERAQSIANYLISRNIAADRITVKGFGGERTLHEGPGTTKEQRYENQRVELSLMPEQ